VVFTIKMGLDFEVLDMDFGECEKVDVSKNATQPPLILAHILADKIHKPFDKFEAYLIFNISPIAILVDTNSQSIDVAGIN
jgi:hypothetical protein